MPSAVRPQVYESPAVSDAKRMSPATAVGTSRRVPDSPSPITWPAPQQYAAPSLVTPQLCRPPAVTDAKVRPPDTRTGVNRVSGVPSPMFPPLLLPQQYAAPTTSSAHVCP